jgi:hypothetical protein
MLHWFSGARLKNLTANHQNISQKQFAKESPEFSVVWAYTTYTKTQTKSLPRYARLLV